MPDVSVIIVSHNGTAKLAACLESLACMPGGEVTTEIIVSDNCSDDKGVESLAEKYPQFTFIRNRHNGGFGYGCNQGALNAAGHYLLFLNPDTVVSAEAVNALYRETAGNSDYMLTSCRQVRAGGSESIAWGEFPSAWNLTGAMRAVLRMIKRKNTLSPEAEQDIMFPDWVSGSVMLIRKDDFKALGGFDDDYWMYYEDVDLCRRIRDKGGRVALFRQMSIEHNHGGSSRINIRTTSVTKTEVMISRHIYISKHKKGFERIAIHAFMVINNLLSGMLPALAGLIFFFVPRLYVRTLIYGRLTAYYAGVPLRHTWLSPRSVNNKK